MLGFAKFLDFAVGFFGGSDEFALFSSKFLGDGFAVGGGLRFLTVDSVWMAVS